MKRETVIEQLSRGVLTITLNRPESRNAFNRQLWSDFGASMSAALENDEVRAVVVTGAGKAFSAGQDLADMAGMDPSSAGAEPGFTPVMDMLEVFDKPLVAAVNGVGVGFGLTFLLHCDYAYISRSARLRAPFVTLGVVPEAASSYLLPIVVGYRHALDLLFESDFFDAERAVQIGLATELCEPGQELARAQDHAARLAAKPLGSLRATKRLLMATRAEGIQRARAREDKAFGGRVGSPENMEAVAAFLEKREADFSAIPSHDRN